MKKRYFFILLSVIPSLLSAQENKDIYGSVETQGIYTSGGVVPFWMRADQFGSLPLAGASGSLLAGFGRNYDSSAKHIVDWGIGFQGRANVGNTGQFILLQADAKVKLWIFEIKAGRSKDIMGLTDSTFSMGSFSVSGNALGIPKLQIAIPQFYTFPILGELFAIQGVFTNGWLGKVPAHYGRNSLMAPTYFHQLSVYGRFGKPGWALHLYGGINHQVYWGSEKEIFGKQFKLSTLKTYEYVVLGKTYEGSKIGNHLGSVDLAIMYDWPHTSLFIYRQNFYDEGALYHLANLRDGLNGVSLTNHDAQTEGLKWRKFVVEFLYSANQAGYPWSKRTPSGDENYYNNYEYPQGWSYQGLALGDPFLTPAHTTRPGLPNDPSDYFNNNRVLAFNTGLQFTDYDWSMTARFSYSQNYGTFGTSIWGASTGNHFDGERFGLFPELNQFSSSLELDKNFGTYFQLGGVLALDNGQLYNNSLGVAIKFSVSY